MADSKPDRKVLTTPVFRVSFPNVFIPGSFDNGPPKYGVTMLFTPADFTDAEKKLWKDILAALDDASMAKFKKHWKDLGDNFKKGLRKGEEKEGLDGYGPGVVFANATSKMKPGLVDRDKNPILNQEQFYPGCYARATITVFAFDNKGKGVSFGLNNLQKVRDGESFSARVDAAEDFGDDLEPDASSGKDEVDPFA
jgi:hypothetical protein